MRNIVQVARPPPRTVLSTRLHSLLKIRRILQFLTQLLRTHLHLSKKRRKPYLGPQAIYTKVFCLPSHKWPRNSKDLLLSSEVYRPTGRIRAF